jgi:hypothetical protein
MDALWKIVYRISPCFGENCKTNIKANEKILFNLQGVFLGSRVMTLEFSSNKDKYPLLPTRII